MNMLSTRQPEQLLHAYEVSIEEWHDGDHDTHLLRDVREDLAKSDLSAEEKWRMTVADGKLRRLYGDNKDNADSYDVQMLKQTLDMIAH